MRNLCACVVLCGAAAWALGCGGNAPSATDGPAQQDAGSDGGGDTGTPGDTGTGDDGGVTDGGCEGDPACAAAGPLCDPAGTDRLGECVDVGGCLALQGLAACPSTLQTCPVGATACACPTSSCNTEVDTACGTDGTVVACRLDVEQGCGIYPETGGLTCPGHQSCRGTPPTAACACDDSDCTGAGHQCSNDASAVLDCQLDGVCPYAASTSPCTYPKVCQGSSPNAACACPPAGSDTRVGRGCATLGVTACDPDAGNINECGVDSVSGCQIWQLAAGTTCTAQQLWCGTLSGAPACQCPPNTTGVFHADATNGSPAGGMPFPTGVLAPSQCRFKLLTPALAAAQTWVMGHLTAEVRATGQTGGTAMHFAEPSYPLRVPQNVTLTTTDSPLDPAHYVIDFAQAGAAAVVQLMSGAALKGFTIQNLVSAATSADGVATYTTCSANTTATIESVVVAGEATPYRLRHGVWIWGSAAGSCDASLSKVAVKSTSQAGLFVQSSDVTVTTRVVDSTFDGCTNGVRVFAGTAELDSVEVTNSSAEGVLVRPTSDDAALAAVAGQVTGSQRDGVRVEAGTNATAASTLALRGTVVSANGSGSGSATRYPGITVQARAAALLGVNVHDNAGGGLQATGAGTTVAIDLDAGNPAHFDSNGTGAANPPSGILIGDGAAVVATGATANANDGPGVHIGGSGSSLTLHGCQVDSNGVVGTRPGLEVEGGTVVVDGASVISNNRGEGIREYAGAVTLSGSSALSVSVRNNGAGSNNGGVYVGGGQADAAFSATWTEFRENVGDGARVHNRNAMGVGQPVDFVNCLFVANTNTGLRVHQSAPTSTGGRSLHVTSCTFQAGDRGLMVEAASNAATTHAVFQGNTVTKAQSAGAIVTGVTGSAISLIGNHVFDNDAPPAPTQHTVGGIIFVGEQPGTFVFTGNRVHNNAADQVGVSATSGMVPPAWDLSAPSCAEANQIWCYNRADSSPPFVGLVASGVTVTANFNAWTHATPASGVDWLLVGAGGVSVGNPCGTGLTCP